MMRPAPADTVVRWMADQPAMILYTTCITQAEILHGVLLLPAGARRRAIAAAAEAVFREDFGGRILPFGSEAAQAYAQIAVDRGRAARRIAHFDAQIAAIARATRATVATRNVANFDGC